MNSKSLCLVGGVLLLSSISAFADLAPEDWKPLLAKGFSGPEIETCLSSANDPMDCVGQQAGVCRDANDQDAVPPTYAEIICVEIEVEWWDARLNEQYKALIKELKEADAERGTAAGQSDASMVESYRAMERVWIPFRDAWCDYEGDSVGSGDAAKYAEARCLMEFTARRTIEIEVELLFYSQQ